MIKKVITLLVHPISLTILFGSLIILAFPSLFNKYNAVLIEQRNNVNDRQIQYSDLDFNNNSEMILYLQRWDKYFSTVVYKDDKVLGQWDFGGEKILTLGKIDGDIDNDGLNEIFIFSLRRDSILFSCLNPLMKKFYAKDIFLSHQKKFNNTADCVIRICDLYDNDKDGFKELYLSVISGFNAKIYSRKMACYDFKNEKLFTSPQSCIDYIEPIAFDLNSDGKKEFFSSTHSPNNCDSTQNYTDKYSWLVVLDSRMNFLFTPQIIGFAPSYQSIKPIIIEGKPHLAVLNLYYGTGNYPSTISYYNASGERIKERKIDYDYSMEHAYLTLDNVSNPSTLFLVDGYGQVRIIDKELQFDDYSRIHGNQVITSITEDIDNDGKKEIVYIDSDKSSLVIARHDFSDYNKIPIPKNSVLGFVSEVKGNKNYNVYIECDLNGFYIQYGKNILYYLKYLIYASIYLFIYLIAFVISNEQKKIIERKHIAEKKIAQLQIKSIKNQIDPHFTLNILNSIGSLFNKKNTKTANLLFGKYSKLLRNTILNSDKIKTTIKDEIEYVKDYLDLEKYRLTDRFEYSITINENVNVEHEIPKTLFHTFIENAVKHSISNIKENGKISLKIESDNEFYQVRITNNGLAQSKHKKHQIESTGMGLIILDEILELFFSLERVKITYNTNNFVSNADNETEVLINIPIKK